MMPHKTKLHCCRFISNSKVNIMVWVKWFLLGANFKKYIKRYGLGAEGVSLGGGL